jgi:cytochrome P450
MGLSRTIQDWTTSPSFQRHVSALLRRHFPVLRLGKFAIVSRYRDVLRVLKDGDHYLIGPINDAKMRTTTGRFILGMDESIEYHREHAALQAAIRPSDLPRIRLIIRQAAHDKLVELRSGVPADLVQGVFRPSAVSFIREYFGLRIPDERVFLGQMRVIFHDLFLNLGNDKAIHERAVRASGEIDILLGDLIRERRKTIGPGGPDNITVLDRLLAPEVVGDAGLDVQGIRRNIAGLIVGAVETTAKALALITNQLLEHPQWMKLAREAALKSDDSSLQQVLFEALRYDPHNPIVIRSVAARADRTANGSPLDKLPEGTLVYAATLSAMFDEEAWVNPGDFRLDRPIEQYLHFGAGLHQCFGRYIVPVLLCESMRQLLACGPLKRIGRLKSAGPFPDQLTPIRQN